MATHISHPSVPSSPPWHRSESRTRTAAALAPLGRLLFALVFILSGVGHFTAAAVGYATSKGVPIPSVLVPLSGILAIVGGLMVALGFRTRVGALIIAVFVVPVTGWMHRFWLETDPMMRAIEQAQFLKNVSMLGAALLLLYFGAGPHSLDERRR